MRCQKDNDARVDYHEKYYIVYNVIRCLYYISFLCNIFCFSITKCIHQVLSWIKWHVLKILFRNNAVNRSSFPVSTRLPLYRSKLTSIVCLQCYTIVIPSTQSNSFGFTRSLLQSWLVCRIDHANLDYIHIYK